MGAPHVIVVGHGSRDADANAEFEALVAAWRATRPDLTVSIAYVELAEPTLDRALAALPPSTATVVALPLFLFAAGHVKNDLPLALAAARVRAPQTHFVAARPLGVHPELASLLYDRAAALVDEPARTTVVVVGRGSSDPDANGDFVKLARLFAEGRGFAHVEPCFVGITRPRLGEALERVARSRPERLVVAPYFLFAGRLMARIADELATFARRYPWIPTALAPHLGADARLFALVDERIREALDGGAPLACDNCQYRAPLPSLEAQVGGLRAMLWSMRHSFTHAQAAPHVHAHRPLTKHVLVCGNVDCAGKGSLAVVEALRRYVKDAGRERDIRVTKTACMGRCGEGPTVAVYPDGIWYRGVQPGDARELADEHLLGDRLVARLVDQIMQ